ncbi:MAG: response regulator transcription factor [Myxococcaceae bacterium]|nr:response regulator transcription factor [Myxococcaceae bacterium]MCA3010913.1 response regulator transcription factor [Myxococcaceae bacterium]
MTAPMARLVLIDDDAALLTALGLALEDAGHVVTPASDGRSGLAMAATPGVELVISDVNLPGLDGFSLCRALRERGLRVPVVLLTSRDGDIDEALGLELGADDYVTKPFSTRVLLARVHALLRREAARAGAADDDTVSVGALSLRPQRLEVQWRGHDVNVTVTEFRLLEALARRPGVVFSRDRLIDVSRGEDVMVGDRLIDTYVRRLRRKFEAADAGFDAIETVIGAGYRWRAS